MFKAGDALVDRSAFNLVEGDEDGRAILSDQWGIFYVTDEQGILQYVGGNELSAEIEFQLPSLASWEIER